MTSSPLQKRLLSYKRKMYQIDSVERIPKFHKKTHSRFEWGKITALLLFVALGLFAHADLQSQTQICDPAFSEGTGNFNNNICLPQDNTEAAANLGFMLSCQDSPTCNVNVTAPTPPTIPTFSGCPTDVVTYSTIPQNDNVFVSYLSLIHI